MKISGQIDWMEVIMDLNSATETVEAGFVPRLKAVPIYHEYDHLNDRGGV